MTHYGMAIDLTHCFGCHTCEAACKIANNMPEDVAYLKVHNQGGTTYDTASGEYPNCQLDFLPMQCQHCEHPACLPVCPTGATQMDSQTGVVSGESDLSIGCGSCIIACPYEGVRTKLPAQVNYYLDLADGEEDAPQPEAGTVEKCTFCQNLVSRGEEPACMQLCPGRARYWGDLDDPNSEVSKLIASRDHIFINEDAGTKPSIYYLK